MAGLWFGRGIFSTNVIWPVHGACVPIFPNYHQAPVPTYICSGLCHLSSRLAAIAAPPLAVRVADALGHRTLFLFSLLSVLDAMALMRRAEGVRGARPVDV